MITCQQPYIHMLFSSLRIGSFQWPITSSTKVIAAANQVFGVKERGVMIFLSTAKARVRLFYADNLLVNDLQEKLHF